MCIILTCESGIRPDYNLIDDCFSQNPDGGGIMWVESGKVQLSKGYASSISLMDAIDSVPITSPLIVHMRIATSGGIDVGTCHPFPITRNLDELHAANAECDAAIAHNGIIVGMPTDDDAGISDTVSFVMRLADHWHGKASKGIRKRIRRDAPNNRFAILTKDGTVTRLGNGWQSILDGIHASNDTWSYGPYFNELMAELGYEDENNLHIPRICKRCPDFEYCKADANFLCFSDEDEYDDMHEDECDAEDRWAFDEYGYINILDR